MSLAEKIRVIEKKMLEGKLVLLGDDGLPLKPSRTTKANFGTDLRGEHHDTIMDDNNPMLADAAQVGETIYSYIVDANVRLDLIWSE
ncbi:hypothetical protein Tco_0363371 [Tanacetum coccineum]